MPCESGYMAATRLEIQGSRVAMLLEESKTGRHVDTKSGGWDGYHREFYNTASVPKLDEMTRELCAYCQTADMSAHSLEMQTWWRDHQREDAARAKSESEKAHHKAARKAAMEKLTEAERKLLGLTP